ncbi:MAG: molybdopterin cofactor-binding domain-containing protein [Bradymonadia bacterium]
MTTRTSLKRRDFLRVTLMGAGTLWVGLSTSGCGGAQEAMLEKADADGVFEPNVFIAITSKNEVQVGVGKSEMGQGIYTTYAILAAEELELDPSAVTIVPKAGPAFQTAGLQITGGSTTTAEIWHPVRKAAATAREMLLEAGAKKMGVPRNACVARLGAVHHEASGKKMTYGELTREAARVKIPEQVTLKRKEQFKIIGRPTDRVDLRPKVTGGPIFGIDVQVPGLLKAIVLIPPTWGSEAESVTYEKAARMKGVKQIFPFEYGVAVVAEKYWQARRAAAAVEITWSATENDRLDSGEIIKGAIEHSKQEPPAHAAEGDFDEAFEGSGKTLEAVYTAPYLAHAPLEPQNATAWVQYGKRVEIWAPTQFQSGVQAAAADIGGVPRAEVICNTTYLGGGFGRRGAIDPVLQALLISKRVKAPVQVMWSREDDMKAGYYRPQAVTRLKGALDGGGKLTGMSIHHLSQSVLDMKGLTPYIAPEWLPAITRKMVGRMMGQAFDSDTIPNIIALEGLRELGYGIPNHRVGYSAIHANVPVLFWRSVGHSVNDFAREGFIDEMAHLAGQDPYDFRVGMLDDADRRMAVLKKVAEISKWSGGAEEGWGRGIAVGKAFGSYVGMVAEAGMVDGTPKVRRIWTTIDCGQVVNPDQVIAQMEGGVIFALSAIFDERIDIKAGRVKQGNFDDFPIARMYQIPEITVEIVETDNPPTGVGELGVPLVPSTVATALFQVTGKRLRSMPFNDALKEVG